MPENGRQQCLPAGAANVLFCDCAKSKESDGPQQMFCEGRATGSVANERNGGGIWQRNLPSYINNYVPGIGPFNAPQSACHIPRTCCFKNQFCSVALTAEGGSGLGSWLGQEPEAPALDSAQCSFHFTTLAYSSRLATQIYKVMDASRDI